MSKQNYYLLFIVIFLLTIWLNIIYWYFMTHTYYFDMLSLSTIFLIFYSLVPVLYLTFAKKISYKWLLLSIFIWLFIFLTSFISSRWWFWWNFMYLLLNIFIMLFFIISFFIWLFFLWNIFKEKVMKIITKNIFDIFISLWIWLSIFLLLILLIKSFNILYPLLSWSLYILLLSLYFFQKESVKLSWSIILEKLSSFNIANLKIWEKINYNYIFSIILLGFSVLYFYYWFMLSWIPYPTAWDANHAYMFYPKMWAINNWFYWTEPFMWTSFQLWYSYITYWFSLFLPISNYLWISADTFAIVSNFFSWILVLVFSLALIKEVLDYVWPKFSNIKDQIFNIWWLLILIWLTSWMWAFLVFVDNKTDLWVMALVILAIYSWFVALKWLNDEKNTDLVVEEDKPVKIFNFSSLVIKTFIISGFLFAIAVMSKPTAFLDAVWFAFLLSWIWIWAISVLWLFLVLIWLLAFLNFRWISDYIYYNMWWLIFLSWIITLAIWLIKTFFKKSISYILLLFVWWITFILTLFIFKWWFFILDWYYKWATFQPSNFVKRVFLSDNSYSKDTNNYKIIENKAPNLLLASTHSDFIDNTCSLNNLRNTEDLYINLLKAPWDTYAEDVWRYVWYWQRTFENPWWRFIFPNNNSCIWFNSNANKICANFHYIENANLPKIQELYDNLDYWSRVHNLLWEIVLSWSFQNNSLSKNEFVSLFNSNIRDLRNYFENNSIKIEKVCLIWEDNNNAPNNCEIYYSDSLKWTNTVIYQRDINIPYSLLVPFNITFNWSLQNESSYYTDIWYMWLILIFILIFSFFYGIFNFNKFLIWINWVSLLLWTIWFFIWWWILWYWLWLIIWTIISFSVFIYTIYLDISLKEKSYIGHTLYNVFIIIFIIMSFLMLLLNIARINTQWWAWPFMWYKNSIWVQDVIWNMFTSNWSIEQKRESIVPYTSDYIFNLQFWHYNKFLDIANSRDINNDWIYIAWTYARYFIEDQHNIRYDQFLTWLWEMFSDYDTCSSYLRLVDQWIKYLVLDPNIWTVVMWDWNISLFNRFFAEINQNTWEIITDWTISMLSKLVSDWYISYLSSNNIWAKYAFWISDDDIVNLTSYDIFEWIPLFRSRLATARYWWNSEQLVRIIAEIFTNRLSTYDAIWDLADMMWRNINEDKVISVARQISELSASWNITFDINTTVNMLTQNEKMVLLNYFDLVSLYSNPSSRENYLNTLYNMIWQSISSSSQIIILEVN